MGSEQQVVIKKEVEVIARECFSGVANLSEVVFEEGSRLQRLEASAFFDTALTKVAIPASVEVVEETCFAFCSRLSEVVLKQGLKRLDVNIFCLCELRELAIPASVEVIGEGCLSGCPSLCKVTFEKGSELREIGKWAFSSTPLHNLELPSKCQILNGKSLRGLDSVTVSKKNPFLVVEDSFLKSYDRKRLIWYMGSERQVVIEKEVEAIGEYCFPVDKELDEVIFEEGSKMQRLGSHAFSDASLRKLVIPVSVQVIEEYCFTNFSCFCEVVCEGHVADIAENAFSGFLDPSYRRGL
jgi:hypothetical protein